MLLLQGRISSPQNMTLCVIGRVRFERNCGKMYSRHLFPYGGLAGEAGNKKHCVRWLELLGFCPPLGQMNGVQWK